MEGRQGQKLPHREAAPNSDVVRPVDWLVKRNDHPRAKLTEKNTEMGRPGFPGFPELRVVAGGRPQTL
jgi:hypothetical protein